MQTSTKHQNSILLLTSLLFLVSAGLVHAQIQDRPKPGPEQKKLEIHVGTWQYEGTVSDSPLGPGGKFKGQSTTRMILDGLFLESRGEDKGVYGGKELAYKSLGVQWYDSAAKTYVGQSYDNDGMVSRSTTTINGNTWSNTGSMTDSKGKTYKTRDVTTFSPDGKTSVTKGEFSTDDGKTWINWWESTAKKTGN